MAHGSTTGRARKTTPARRSIAIPIALSSALVASTLAFIAYRASETLSRPKPPVRLRLSPDVQLTPPPPLPSGNDLVAVQNGLRQVADMLTEARLHPADAAAHLQIARTAMGVRDLLTAREEIRTAIRMDAQAPPMVYDALGSCQAQLGMLTPAVRTYRDLIARAPRDAAGYLGLSRVQFYLEQRKESLRTLEDGAHALVSSDTTGRLALAQEFEARAEPLRALAEAQNALDAKPGDPAAGLLTARLLTKLGRLPEARTLLDKVIAEHPDNAAAHHYLADVLDSPLLPRRDPALVEDALLKTIKLDPRDASAYSRLGRFYQDQGLNRQAAYIYTRLIEMTPDSAASRLQLSYLYTRLGDRRIGTQQQQIAEQLLARDREAADLENRRNHHPGDAQNRLALARHYVSAGQFANALVEFQAAYCLAPTSSQVRSEISGFYTRMGLRSAFPEEGKNR